MPVRLFTDVSLCSHIAQTAKLKSNDVEAWSSLLQLCSHYDPSSRSSSSRYHDDMAESRANKLFSGKEVRFCLVLPRIRYRLYVCETL
jgi:hypothetical protein